MKTIKYIASGLVLPLTIVGAACASIEVLDWCFKHLVGVVGLICGASLFLLWNQKH